MSKVKYQFIVSFSFAILLIGLAFFVTGLSKKTANDNLHVEYLQDKEKEVQEAPNFLALIRQLAGFEKEMSYLILFQNNLELRPTGGFVSSFATAKVKESKPKDFNFYGTAVFDLTMSKETNITPPGPIEEYLWVKNWQFRDGNWSPDFPTAAQKMIELYHLQGGEEEFDGVIAITPEILKSLLEIHGPIELKDYGLTIDKDNFLLTIEKQVEIDYKDQGIPRSERKDILKDLAQVLIEKTVSLNPLKSLRLINLAKDHLEKKDILLYFKDPQIQEDIAYYGWTGEVKQTNSDYIYVVDANVNAFKADLFVKRNISYELDLSTNTPKARITINYEHTAEEESWLTRDYKSWLRVYLPEGSWVTKTEGLSTVPEYNKEFSKTFVAALVSVPTNSSHRVVLEYNLPTDISFNPYTILIQKQPGINELPVEITLIGQNETSKTTQKIIEQDTYFEL